MIIYLMIILTLIILIGLNNMIMKRFNVIIFFLILNIKNIIIYLLDINNVFKISKKN
jgi:hypothetical protein